MGRRESLDLEWRYGRAGQLEKSQGLAPRRKKANGPKVSPGAVGISSDRAPNDVARSLVGDRENVACVRHIRAEVLVCAYVVALQAGLNEHCRIAASKNERCETVFIDLAIEY